ncbi:hypothetical protein [Asticcacaulis biprosthecium]|nr:hypothetical protein [Asticcacaulis biprosthecium]
MRAILVILSGLMLSGAAVAADLPIAPPSPMIRSGAEAPNVVPFAQAFSLGSLNLAFESQTLQEVRGRIGGGVIDRLGDSGDRIDWLCYDLPGARLWLAEYQGKVRELTLAVRPAKAPASSHCPALLAKFQSVRIDGAITLGTSRADLIQRLGQPAKQAGDWLAFHREAPAKGDEDNELIVRLENGKVAALWAKKVTSR